MTPRGCQALKAVKTSEFMPFVVFIAAPPVDIMRNMHEYARMRGKVESVKSVRSLRSYVFFLSQSVTWVRQEHKRRFYNLCFKLVFGIKFMYTSFGYTLETKGLLSFWSSFYNSVF